MNDLSHDDCQGHEHHRARETGDGDKVVNPESAPALPEGAICIRLMHIGVRKPQPSSKGGLDLEEGGKVRSLAHAGKPVVTDVSTLRGNAGDSLQLATSLADRSGHPVSTAASRYCPEQAGSAPVSAVTLRVTLLDQSAA